MRRAVCPGTFDPVTNGHVDIVTRAARLFDEVVVAIGVNASKNRLFDADERLAMLERATAHLDNVRVDGFTGLLTTYCVDNDVRAIVKGLRSGGDFDYELQMAQMNAGLAPGSRRSSCRPARRTASCRPRWSRRWRRTAATCRPTCRGSCSTCSPSAGPRLLETARQADGSAARGLGAAGTPDPGSVVPAHRK